MQAASSALVRRLAGALILSLALHAVLMLNLKPASARYTGGAPLRVHLSPANEAARVQNISQVHPAFASRSPDAQQRDGALDRNLAKEYLQNGIARRGNLPDGRDAPIELPLPLLRQYYTAREVDLLAAPLEEVPLTDPAVGPGPGKSARVVLLVLINEQGGVDSVATLQSSPPGMFDDMARSAFAATRFSPALKDGKPVKSQKIVEILYGS